MKIWRMRFACGITKATDTHSEYVMLLQGNKGFVNASLCYLMEHELCVRDNEG